MSKDTDDTDTTTEWVYREGFGWVERPVEVPVVEAEDDVERESAAA